MLYRRGSSVRIEVWSDVVCPWCYLGKRRMESAIANFEHADEVAVLWRSFELNPDAPRKEDMSVEEILSRKYGMSREEVREMNARITALAEAEGLEYRLDRARGANSFDAHRMIHLAAEHGIQGVMKERLMRAHFTESAAIGDPEELVRMAVEVGIEEGEARNVVQSDRFAKEVGQDEADAAALGISGVPFFVIDGTWGISGAQTTDVFAKALDEMWAELHPAAVQKA